MRADSPLFASRVHRRGRRRPVLLALGLGAAGLVLVAVLVGLAFAGSRSELAEGARVAGVDVGGLSRREALALLERRFQAVAAQPVIFVADGERFPFAARQLGVEPDYRGAVRAAAGAGDGFGPLRGFRRLHTRFFGAEVLPRVAASNAALEAALDRIAAAVDVPAESAALVRRGLRIEVQPARSGLRLDRDAAAELLVRSLGALERTRQVELPLVRERPAVTAPM
ncbi:MAG TPA: peptidoglycan binding domain-containing protein, partial [Gaiellaceae bacterium]|nr:peptidoglycan binding domain-containing protein [Gaiellaceae bacterium]